MALSTGNLLNAPNVVLNLLFILAEIRSTLVSVNSICLIIVLHTHSRTRFCLDLLNRLVDGLLVNKLISIVSRVTCTTWSLVLWFFAHVVISLIKWLRSSYNILTSSSKSLWIVAIIVVLWLNNDALRSLRSMGWVPERLTLLNLLINYSKCALQVLSVLLIKWRHSELLMNESMLFTPKRSVAIMSIISKLQVLVVTFSSCPLCLMYICMWIHWTNAAQKALILY
jgi:hypothetical protein